MPTRKFKVSSEVQGVLVIVAIFLQTVYANSFLVVANPYYVKALYERGISRFLIGLFGMMPGIGFTVNLIYPNFLSYLVLKRKLELKTIQFVFMCVFILCDTSQGIAWLIPSNSLFICSLLITRFVHGLLSHSYYSAILTCCNTWLPDHASIAISASNAGFYVGIGYASVIGSVLYDLHGYTIPYLVLGILNTTILMFNIAVLPANSRAVYLKPSSEGTEKGEGLFMRAEKGEGLLTETEEGEGQFMRAEEGEGLLTETEEGEGQYMRAEEGEGLLMETEEGEELITGTEEGEGLLTETDEGEGQFMRAEEGEGLLMDIEEEEELDAGTEDGEGLVTGADDQEGHLTYSGSMEENETKKDSLTSAIVMPIIAFVLIDVFYGYIGCITVPYLVEVFDVTVTQGGSYLLIHAVSLYLGSILSGPISRSKLVHPTEIMAGGAVLVGTGMWFMFPHPSFSNLYNNVPIISYFCVFLIGFGNQLVAVVAFNAIEDVQMVWYRRGLTPKHRVFCSELCEMGSNLFMAGGSMIAMIVLEYMNYVHGAWMMCALAGLSFVISVLLDVRLSLAR